MINRAIAVCIAAFTASGCSFPLQPAATYDIQQPIQTTVDYLESTRHFTGMSDIRRYLKDMIGNEDVVLSNGAEWQQLFVRLPSEFTSEQKKGLNDNLSRTCWSLKRDAQLQPMSQAHRGANSINTVFGCVSKRLGNDYPLFTVSYVNDNVTQPYITVVSPKQHYTSLDFRCKAKREGYEYVQPILCYE